MLVVGIGETCVIVEVAVVNVRAHALHRDVSVVFADSSTIGHVWFVSFGSHPVTT